MERDSNQAPAVIDLGSVSGDTQGDRGVYWEGFALQPHAGISDE
jgi:hypothetical protein